MARFLSKIGPADVGGIDGKVRYVLGNKLEVQLDLAKLSPDMVMQLAIHGAKQKVGDAASGDSKTNDFTAAFGHMQQVVDNLESGIFNARGGAGTSDLVAALVRVKGLDADDAQAAVDAMDEDKLKQIQSHPAIKAAILAIKAERAQANADTAEADDLDALLK